MLPLATFETIIASTPLISIDLIVKNEQGQVLLGKRNNQPAKGFWFVPGGRVLKDEPLEQAYNRLLMDELGIRQTEAKFLGVYQHFYDESFISENISTHYIVLAYEVMFTSNEFFELLPKEQHSDYQWFSVENLTNEINIHEHTKWYFQENTAADCKIKI